MLKLATAASAARLLLCAAPAGFGKTIALIAWAEQRRAEAAAVAWYTLGSPDNVLPRFAAHLVAAFDYADVGLQLTELRQHAGADSEHLLVRLLNALAVSERRYLLVLDDYHLIQTATVHHAVVMLIEHLPANVQVAIGTRTEPPLPLARLGAQGLLAEVRATDLQFDRAEIAAFFDQRLQTKLAPQTLDVLADWTEGWAAGLQLIALSLPPEPTGQAVIEQLRTHYTSSRRNIFSFLADEVFAQQPAEYQSFLLATSVLEHLTPALCDAVVQEADASIETVEHAADPHQTQAAILPASAFILEQLEQASLFLIRLNNALPMYRYHHLFADFLRRRLELEQPGRAAILHRRAAHWYAATGEPVQAVQHALAAGDAAYAADLIVHSAWPQLSARGEIATVLRWAEQFRPAQLRSEPLLCLYFARAAYLCEQASASERFFALAEQGLAGNTETPALRATLLTYRAAAASLNGELTQAQSWLVMHSASTTSIWQPTQCSYWPWSTLLRGGSAMSNSAARHYSPALTTIFRPSRH